MQYDEDGFNRWDAGQTLSVRILQRLIESISSNKKPHVPQPYIEAMRAILKDSSLDKAMVCKLLILPAESYLVQLSEETDIDFIHQAREFVRGELATQLSQELLAVYKNNAVYDGADPLSYEAMSQRALKNTALALLGACLNETAVAASESIKAEYLSLSEQQFATADNMTDVFSALGALVNSGNKTVADVALEKFHTKWKNDAQVMEQWFSVQASSAVYADLTVIEALMELPDFDITNPNKVRSVVGAFCNQNLVHFHKKDGSGYRFLADIILKLDRLNPQIASRLMAPLTRWKRYDKVRQSLLRAQLERIQSATGLSKDVREVVEKSLV